MVLYVVAFFKSLKKNAVYYESFINLAANGKKKTIKKSTKPQNHIQRIALIDLVLKSSFCVIYSGIYKLKRAGSVNVFHTIAFFLSQTTV